MKEETGAHRENPCKDGTLALLRKVRTLLAMRWLQISSYFSSGRRKHDAISKFCNVTAQINVDVKWLTLRKSELKHSVACGTMTRRRMWV